MRAIGKWALRVVTLPMVAVGAILWGIGWCITRTIELVIWAWED